MSQYREALASVTADPRYLANLDWGVARPGHPEGTIRAHVDDLEKNLAILKPKLTAEDCWKLKLLIHTHDTFKPESEDRLAISHPKSHASLARVFLAAYCDDPDLLAMVQCHDEPHALYQQLKRKGKYDRERFDRLLGAVEDWNLFLAFNIIDGCTAGKSRAPLRWWLREVAGKVDSRFSEADVIE